VRRQNSIRAQNESQVLQFGQRCSGLSLR
jgi:hypothetical protein